MEFSIAIKLEDLAYNLVDGYSLLMLRCFSFFFLSAWIDMAQNWFPPFFYPPFCSTLSDGIDNRRTVLLRNEFPSFKLYGIRDTLSTMLRSALNLYRYVLREIFGIYRDILNIYRYVYSKRYNVRKVWIFRYVICTHTYNATLSFSNKIKMLVCSRNERTRFSAKRSYFRQSKFSIAELFAEVKYVISYFYSK